MDAFTFYITSGVDAIPINEKTDIESAPTDEDNGGSGNNAYCVIA